MTEVWVGSILALPWCFSNFDLHTITKTSCKNAWCPGHGSRGKLLENSWPFLRTGSSSISFQMERRWQPCLVLDSLLKLSCGDHFHPERVLSMTKQMFEFFVLFCCFKIYLSTNMVKKNNKNRAQYFKVMQKETFLPLILIVFIRQVEKEL